LDRGRRAAALALVLALGSLAASDSPPLAEMRWLAPGADPLAALGWQPPECLRNQLSTEDQLWLVDVGRAAFRSPLILGGQAARAGVSCETCHRNGRDNPAFQFPGVSGAPGTADVTSSLFSSHRGNGVDDPRPIPDLSGPRSALKVSRDPASRALETFIHGLITEEFDGPEPSPAVLAGLAAYVRGLDPEACEARGRRVTASYSMSSAIHAAFAADRAVQRGDSATALTLFAAARVELGRVDERFAGLPRSQAALRKTSARLAAVEALVRAGDPAARPALARWWRGMDPLMKLIRREESRSLFNHRRLAAQAPLPRKGP